MAFSVFREHVARAPVVAGINKGNCSCCLNLKSPIGNCKSSDILEQGISGRSETQALQLGGDTAALRFRRSRGVTFLQLRYLLLARAATTNLWPAAWS